MNTEMSQVLIPVQVENTDFDVLLQDVGDKRVLTVFKDGTPIGSKAFGLLVDTERGAIEYMVKAILKANAVESIQN